MQERHVVFVDDARAVTIRWAGPVIEVNPTTKEVDAPLGPHSARQLGNGRWIGRVRVTPSLVAPDLLWITTAFGSLLIQRDAAAELVSTLQAWEDDDGQT